jgi:ATP-dependent DNA ligase
MASPAGRAKLPSGSQRLHETAKTVRRVRIYSRSGNDPTYRFPLIVEALARLRSELAFLIKSRWEGRKATLEMILAEPQAAWH